MDQAAAVVMGAAPARTGGSQRREDEEGDEGGETGAGNAYYLRPLVEGSDSDVEPRNWTAHVSERRGIVPLTLPRLLLALAVRVLDSVSPFLSCRVGGSTDVRL